MYMRRQLSNDARSYAFIDSIPVDLPVPMRGHENELDHMAQANTHCLFCSEPASQYLWLIEVTA